MNNFEISLKELHFHAHHGMMAQERKVGNEFVVSITVCIPFSMSILDDELEATISYADIYNIVKKEVHSPKKLLETVAASIVFHVKEKWPQIISGQVTIRKMTPPIPGVTGFAEVTLNF